MPFLPGEQDAPGTGYPTEDRTSQTPDSSNVPDRVWDLCEKAIAADGRLKEQRTVRRTAFAIGQVAKLALRIGSDERASGRVGKYSLPPGTYSMPDYEAEHDRIPHG
jgi:hypothetical protein